LGEVLNMKRRERKPKPKQKIEVKKDIKQEINLWKTRAKSATELCETKLEIAIRKYLNREPNPALVHDIKGIVQIYLDSVAIELGIRGRKK